MSQQGRPVETVLAGEAGAAAAFSGMHDSVILLVVAFAAARSLPLQKAKLDADSLAISAMAVLWGLVCIFESYRAYRGELLAAKVLLPLAAGLAASLFPRSRTAIGLSYTVVFAVWLVLKGKPVSFLQTFHHFGAPWDVYLGLVLENEGLWIFLFLNSFIHTVMYTCVPPSCVAASGHCCRAMSSGGPPPAEREPRAAPTRAGTLA